MTADTSVLALAKALDRLFEAETMNDTPEEWTLVEAGLACPDPEVRDTALSVLSTYVIPATAKARIAEHAAAETEGHVQRYCALLLCCGWS